MENLPAFLLLFFAFYMPSKFHIIYLQLVIIATFLRKVLVGTLNE